MPKTKAEVNGTTTSLVGAISEQTAICRLLALGHKVAVPVVDDDGVDLIVDYRYTVNVKARRRPRSPNASGTYAFNLTTWEYRREAVDAQRSRSMKRRSFSAVDFLICHGVADDAWWVIPTTELPSVWLLSLVAHPQFPTKNAPFSRKYRDAWHLFD